MEPPSLRLLALGCDVITVRHLHLPTCFMNVLRHALQCDVPVLAVDRVQFLGYNGELESETIGHHFGYMPIRRKDNRVPVPDVDTATFRVDVAVDAGSLALRWVTSRDVVLVPSPGEADATKTKPPPVDAEAVSYSSPEEEALAKYDDGYKLCPLLPGQKLIAVATAIAGTARLRDPRWSPGHVAVKVLENSEDTASVSAEFPEPSRPLQPDGYEFTFTGTGAVPPLAAYITALKTIAARFSDLSAALAAAP
jgi:hypothetical protein